MRILGQSAPFCAKMHFWRRRKKGENIFYNSPHFRPQKSADDWPVLGAFGALKVLSTVNPATLCSSNRMEIIPQSDFNILTKIMPRNAKDMDVHHCAFWGNVHLFAQILFSSVGESNPYPPGNLEIHCSKRSCLRCRRLNIIGLTTKSYGFKGTPYEPFTLT